MSRRIKLKRKTTLVCFMKNSIKDNNKYDKSSHQKQFEELISVKID